MVEERNNRYQGMIIGMSSTLAKPLLIKMWQRVACFLTGVGAGISDGGRGKSGEELKTIAFHFYRRYNVRYDVTTFSLLYLLVVL
jgi:hypothetical protein